MRFKIKKNSLIKKKKQNTFINESLLTQEFFFK